MSKIAPRIYAICLALFVVLPSIAFASEIDRFVGRYTGQAEVYYQGKPEHRDMSVTIDRTKDGFVLSWTSVSYKSDGRKKVKTYTIEFSPSIRSNIYKSQMKKNLFGKTTPLDPLQGEPFVWARIKGDTLSVFSLFINDIGGYEIQEFHRTIIDEGLDLVFRRVNNGEPEKEIHTILKRVE